MTHIDLYLQQLINGVVNGGAYALIAVGLTLVFGIVGITNFAHGEFLMLGGYGTLLFTTILGVNFWIAMVGAMILVTVLAMLFEKTIFRPIRFSDPMNNIIASMGLSILLVSLAENIFSSQPQQLPPPITGAITIGGVITTNHRVVILVLAIILIIALNLFIKHTWTGRAMRSVSQDLTAAKLMGININKVASVTFAISGMLTAAAGALLAPLYLVEPHMGTVFLMKAFAVVILGGIGNVQGAIYAAFLLGVSESLAAQFIQTGYKDLVAFVVLILVLIFKPNGLFGLREH